MWTDQGLAKTEIRHLRPQLSPAVIGPWSAGTRTASMRVKIAGVMWPSSRQTRANDGQRMTPCSGSTRQAKASHRASLFDPAMEWWRRPSQHLYLTRIQGATDPTGWIRSFMRFVERHQVVRSTSDWSCPRHATLGHTTSTAESGSGVARRSSKSTFYHYHDEAPHLEDSVCKATMLRDETEK
jgi:hypothetical protein